MRTMYTNLGAAVAAAHVAAEADGASWYCYGEGGRYVVSAERPAAELRYVQVTPGGTEWTWTLDARAGRWVRTRTGAYADAAPVEPVGESTMLKKVPAPVADTLLPLMRDYIARFNDLHARAKIDHGYDRKAKPADVMAELYTELRHLGWNDGEILDNPDGAIRDSLGLAAERARAWNSGRGDDNYREDREGGSRTVRAALRLCEGVSKRVGPDAYKFKGKVGHWRTVSGSELFFPDDGGAPLGMPAAMAAAAKPKRRRTR